MEKKDLMVYIGERDFEHLESDCEINSWYTDEILDHSWEIKPNHSSIILWPHLDFDGEFRLIMINLLRESFSSWRVGSTEVLYSWDITDFYNSKNKSKTSYKKSKKYNQIFNQDNSKVQLPHNIFFNNIENYLYPTFLYIPLTEILTRENDINDDILYVLENVHFSFDSTGKLEINSDIKLEKFIAE